MLNNITWTNYGYGLALLLVIYYGFILFRFYAGDLKAIFAGRLKPGQPQRNPFIYEDERADAAQPAGDDQTFAATREENFEEVEQLIGRLKKALAECPRDSREEVGGTIRLILKDYPSLKYSPFAPAIQELVASECAKNGTDLSEDDVAALWD